MMHIRRSWYGFANRPGVRWGRGPDQSDLGLCLSTHLSGVSKIVGPVKIADLRKNSGFSPKYLDRRLIRNSLASMGQELAVKSDRSSDGRAMAALSEQHHAFVLRLMELGPTKKAAAKASGDVGFHPNHGYVLMRDDRVLAAIREESTKQLAGAALLGVKVMVEIAQDKDHKDRYKAAKDLAAINGFTAEQRIVVEHISADSKEMIGQIRAMAKELGLDPSQLIRGAGIAEDAEFTEVPDGE